ncbi:MAG: GGDEF domain-containing protein [Bauldia sp.]|nr:GGDEF domain-containing protein [Bauldia sp.]
MRHRFGLGVFIAALGTLHFLETYLAAILYVSLPLGIVFSPGSTILFAGKLSMLLLVYVREDAAAVRQPIYGLLFGNFLMVALVALMRQHQLLEPMAERLPDFKLMNEMGGLMIWGTLLLFVDSIAMILLYERTGRWLGNRITLRVWLSLAAVLTFDQVGFYLALKFFVGAPVSVLIGGWVGKMIAVAIYSLLIGAYLRWGERRVGGADSPRLADVFDALTYRQRYEALLKQTGRDGLTGLLDRGRLNTEGPRELKASVAAGRPMSLLIVDVDHFKSINDRHGHAMGDAILQLIAGRLSATMRETDAVYRFGGEEFVLLCQGLPHGAALLAAERLRRDMAAATATAGQPVTVSIGVATAPHDGSDFEMLFTEADRRLYKAKSAGRNRVVGRAPEDLTVAPSRSGGFGV